MLSKYSVKKPYTVIVGILLVIVLGVIAFSNMSTDLLPKMNMPYVVVYTSYIGATPEQVESTVTRPMEASFATLTGVKNIDSTSSENVSVIIMEFSASTNMDTVLIEISSKVDLLSGDWDDSVGAPVVMKINPDMLPVSILTAAHDNMDIYALSQYVEETLVPQFEGIEGVASVNVSGAIDQQVTVTIDQNRIDVLNSAILREIDAELADAEAEINDAQAQIADGKRTLAEKKSQTLSQIDGMLSQLGQGADQLPAAISGAQAQRDELARQLATVETTLQALGQLEALTPEQMAQLEALNQRLAALRTQKEDLEAKLAALDSSGSDPTLQAEYDSAIARRDQLYADRAGYVSHIADLKLLDPDLLRAEIVQLEADIPLTQASAAAARQVQTGLQQRRQELLQTIHSLEAQISAAEAGGAGASPDATATGTAAASPSASEGSSATSSPTISASVAPSGTPAASETTGASPSVAPSSSVAPSPSATGEPSSTGTAPVPVTSAGAAIQNLYASDAFSTAGAATPGSSELEIPDSTESPADDGTKGPTAAPRQAPEGESTAEPAGSGGNVAYAEEASIESLRQALAAAKSELSSVDAQLTAADATVQEFSDKLTAQENRLATCKSALENLESAGTGSGEDVQGRIDEINEKIDAIDAELATLEARIAELENQLLTDEEREQRRQELQRQLDTVDSSISAIENSQEYQTLLLAADADALAQKFAELTQAKAQLEAGIAQADATIAKLKSGIIPGGFIEGIDEDTDVAQAQEQLRTARAEAVSAFDDAASQLRDASSELAQGRLEFEQQRDEALENAGLDGVITLQMVSSIIGAQNFAMPAGYVDEGEESYLVRVGEEFQSLSELKCMKLFSLGLDSIDEVRLLDVASVELTDNSEDVFTKVNGTDGVILSFEKQSNYSTADVAERIQEKTEQLMAEDGQLTLTELMNQGMYIGIVIDSVLDNLIYGGILAVIVLLLFLLDIRPTLVVALSIPISVVIAFVAMFFSNITLNVLSLSGLALGIGMLVDNSIVAIENIYRLHNEENMPVLRACVEGVRQVSGALFSSTLTTVCVFLPFVFFDGLTKDLFSDLGLTITYSLLASLLVAMTVVPSMSASLLKRNKPMKERKFYAALRSGYVRLLRGALRIKPLVLLAAVALLAFSGWRVLSMNMVFMPEVSSTQMTVTLPLDSEMPESEQHQLILDVMDDIMAVEFVDSVGVTTSPIMSIGAAAATEEVTYYLTVDENSGVTNREIGDEILASGQRRGLDLAVSTSTMDITMLSGEGISIDITGPEIETLRAIATDIAGLVGEIDGATDISDGLEKSVPQLSIVVDKDLANDESLTVAQVYQFIAQKLAGPVEITRVTLDGKEYPVEVVEGANLALTPDQLENLEISVQTDEESKRVRIGDIAQIEDTMSLASISRQNQQRTLSVTFNVDADHSLTQANSALTEKLAAYTPPDGYTVALSGENETVMTLIDNLLLVILIALAFIFLIMVAQFQSFKSPLIVMFTIPLAFTGGLLALILTGMDVSVVSMIGFLILSGVVVNNGIVFVDCINQLRIGGMSKREAILETGRLRLRPILMTALTTILGMFTMALGTGMGAEMMQPMAIVSIGGLTYATLMTLFVVPILYDLFNGEKMKAREIDMIRESAGLRADEEVLGADDSGTGAAPAGVGSIVPEQKKSDLPPTDSAVDSDKPVPIPENSAEADSSGMDPDGGACP